MRTLYCKVHPLARPRKGVTGSIYQPKKDQLQLKRELALYIPDAIIGEPCIVDCKMYFENPARAGDVDNLWKAVLDALVAVKLLTDDRIVVGGEVWKLQSTEDYVEITIWGLEGTACLTTDPINEKQ